MTTVWPYILRYRVEGERVIILRIRMGRGTKPIIRYRVPEFGVPGIDAVSPEFDADKIARTISTARKQNVIVSAW